MFQEDNSCMLLQKGPALPSQGSGAHGPSRMMQIASLLRRHRISACHIRRRYSGCPVHGFERGSLQSSTLVGPAGVVWWGCAPIVAHPSSWWWRASVGLISGRRAPGWGKPCISMLRTAGTPVPTRGRPTHRTIRVGNPCHHNPRTPSGV